MKLDSCETKNKDKTKKRWIAAPHKDAADEKTKRTRAARKSLAGSLLIAKTRKEDKNWIATPHKDAVDGKN